MKPCPKCHGTGRLEGSQAAPYRDWFAHPIVVVCPRCDATGVVPPGRHYVTHDRPYDTLCGIVTGRVDENRTTHDISRVTCIRCLDCAADEVSKALVEPASPYLKDILDDWST